MSYSIPVVCHKNSKLFSILLWWFIDCTLFYGPLVKLLLLCQNICSKLFTFLTVYTYIYIYIYIYFDSYT